VDGLNGTTVRAIASDAGVSPGLVIHHFGSKDGLHRACDEYVVRSMVDLKRQALETGSYRQGGAIATMYQMALPALRYMAWTLGTGSETAARIFDELIDDAVELFEFGEEAGLIGEVYGDPRKQAAVLVAMQFAALVFHDHLTRAFEVDMLTAEGLAIAAPYTLQIFSGDLFDQDVIAQTRQALREMESDREASS
jgi:AcrR family transcriptional regulator